MAGDVTKEDLRMELVRALYDEPAPEGWYTARELWEYAREQGRDVTLAAVRNRLIRAAEAGRIDCRVFGNMNYYRVGDQGEV